MNMQMSINRDRNWDQFGILDLVLAQLSMLLEV